MGLMTILKSIFAKRSKEDIEIEKQVKKNGVRLTAKQIAEEVNKKISSKELARQFILEELDSARQGNSIAQNFVKNSGFKPYEYLGASNRTKWEGEESELEYLQLFVRLFTSKIREPDLMIELSIRVLDEIMKIWELGKYKVNNTINIETSRLIDLVEKKHYRFESILAEINDDLNNFINEDLLQSQNYDDKLILMAYGYARRFAAAGLFLQGIFTHDEYQHSKDIFYALQSKTGQTVKFQEDAFAQSLEYIQSYDKRISRDFTSKVVIQAENKEVLSVHDFGTQITFEGVFQMFNKVD